VLNSESLRLERPRTVVQVFCHAFSYGKEDRRRPGFFPNRAAWTQPVDSNIGHPDGASFVISRAALGGEAAKFAACDVLLLADLDARSDRQLFVPSIPAYRCIEEGRSASMAIFSLHGAEDRLDLAVEYRKNLLRIGKPSRHDGKIAELRTGSTVRVMINGRLPTRTLFGRGAPIYFFHDYYFQVLGRFASFRLGEPGELERPKHLPAVVTRTIDLRAQVY